MSERGVRWLGVWSILALVGVAALMGHAVLAVDLGLVNYVLLVSLATLLGLGMGWAAAAVNRRHREEVERRNEELSALNAVAVAASRSLELSSLIGDCLSKTLEAAKLDGGAVLIADSEGCASLAASQGLGPGSLDDLQQALLKEVAGGEVVVRSFPPARRRASPVSGPCSSVVVPLRSEGHVVGAMYLVTYRPRVLSSREVQILVAIGDVIGMAVRNARLHAQMSEHAIRDPLTGLYNRRYFDRMYSREVERSRRHSLPLAVAMVDIDSFKQINDRCGHKAGDQVLVRVARILEEGRGSDVVARYGGDEFVVMMPNTDVYGAAAVADRLRSEAAALKLPGIVEQGLRLSIGLAGSVEGYHDLLDRADDRMYVAKHAGRPLRV